MLTYIHCGSLASLLSGSAGDTIHQVQLYSLFYLEAVVVEKMTAAPLPLVKSSDNYLSTSSEENSAEEVEDGLAEGGTPFSIL